MWKSLTTSALACAAACGPTVPPAAPAPRAATRVAAPVERTWDAVVETFADNSIPIRTMERASGFVVTEDLAAGPLGLALSDCGVVSGDTLAPDLASYNVLVRGDATSSTVRVTARFVVRSLGRSIDCTSNGRWENAFEENVAARAEGRPPRIPLVRPAEPAPPPVVAFTAQCSTSDYVERDRGRVVVQLYADKGGHCEPVRNCSYVAATDANALARCRAEAKKEE